MNTTIYEMKNTLEGINIRIIDVEEWISKVEDSGNHWHREKKKKKQRRVWDLSENNKCTNIHIIGFQKEKREKGPRQYLKWLKPKKIHNMRKETLTQVEEEQRSLYRITPRQNKVINMLNKLTKVKYKEKILKATREKWQIAYKGTLIRITALFSAETL